MIAELILVHNVCMLRKVCGHEELIKEADSLGLILKGASHVRV
jgi:hypothetical protein